MAQSAKLFVFEERADVTIEQTRSIPIELARTGRVGLTQTEISKLIGRLFIERTAVTSTPSCSMRPSSCGKTTSGSRSTS